METYYNHPAPIVLFVYNRLWHTQQTVQALLRCELASESDLYIFADGPKADATEEQRIKISDVRNYIHTIKGFSHIFIEEAEKNKGLANSVITGVSKIIEKKGKVIVLEDDIVVSSHFLKYMNQSLDLYENVEKVVCINGFSIIKDAPIKEHTYFQYGADCWGWATWKRGWDIFNPDGQSLMNYFLHNRTLKKRFTYDGSYPYLEMLQSQIDGEIDSWAIRWYASAIVKECLCLYPSRSLVQNIGFGDGTHCDDPNCYEATITADESLSDFPMIPVRDSWYMRKEWKKLFKKLYTIRRKPCRKTTKTILRGIMNYIETHLSSYIDTNEKRKKNL